MGKARGSRKRKPYVKDLVEDEIRWGFMVTTWRKKLWDKQIELLLEADRIKEAMEETGVSVLSVCFDCFMRRPFFKGKGSRRENLEYFSRALDGMERIGARLIEVPMVDDSSVKNKEERESALEFVREMGSLIANVHIKDRVFRNGTVPLGTGSADFDQVFSALRETGYQGSFILQAARGEDGQEEETICGQMRFVEEHAARYSIGA